MLITEFLPLLAGGCVAIFFVLCSLDVPLIQGRGRWMLPAGLSFLFFCWSLVAVFVEGPLGFWTEHTRNLWGNQIWFDLLFAASIGWYFAVPTARRLKMNLIPWLMVVLGTGCIGFLAMPARINYLDQKADETC